MLATCTLFALVAVGTAAPAAPSCEATLTQYCEKTKFTPECLPCVKDHGKDAICTIAQEDLFCGIRPPVPPDTRKCFETLQADCGNERRNHTQCLHCVDEHKSTVEKANCTINEVNEFCTWNPVPPGVQKCFTEFGHFCTKDRGANKTMCFDCLKLHESELKHLNCTAREAEEWCDEPVPPPAPPVPHELCYRVLYTECDHARGSPEECVACAQKYEKTDNCTKEEVDMFCHVGPGPGPVPPGQQCFRDMHKDCEYEVGKPSCLTCGKEHEKTSNCSTKEIEEFCRIAPMTCPHLFEDYCGMDRHNQTLCDTCITRHTKNITAAKCSVAAGMEFCKGPPAPTPGDKCTTLLREVCDKVPKGSACISCEQDHHEETKAAGCTNTELFNFCKVNDVFDSFEQLVLSGSF